MELKIEDFYNRKVYWRYNDEYDTNIEYIIKKNTKDYVILEYIVDNVKKSTLYRNSDIIFNYQKKNFIFVEDYNKKKYIINRRCFEDLHSVSNINIKHLIQECIDKHSIFENDITILSYEIERIKKVVYSLEEEEQFNILFKEYIKDNKINEFKPGELIWVYNSNLWLAKYIDKIVDNKIYCFEKNKKEGLSFEHNINNIRKFNDIPF